MLNRKKTLKVFAISTLAILLLVITLQFRSVVDNPPVTAEIEVPQEIRNILTTSCYDCHSNQTKVSWVQKLPFISSLVASDVKKARSVMNFSTWDKYNDTEKRTLIFSSVTKAKNGTMPPENYVLIHPEAAITENQKAVLDTWLISLNSTDKVSEQSSKNYKDIFDNWNPIRKKGFEVEKSPQGIEFPYQYRTWQVIAPSSRIDNGTIRVVLGNQIAIDDIYNKSTNPWSDGAILCKLVWKERKDPAWEGAVVPAEFVHIEIMEKDKIKYASTEGWGWARWLTDKLVPFGKSGNESINSCIDCHKPVANNDWVFTHPAIMP